MLATRRPLRAPSTRAQAVRESTTCRPSPRRRNRASVSIRSSTATVPFTAALPRLDALLRDGVTTVEIKSGYGLDVEQEARALRIAREVTDETTYLGAHVVPPAFADDQDLWRRVGTEHLEIVRTAARACGWTWSSPRVVDWGCGGGANAVAVAPHAGELVLVDLSARTLEECARQVAARSSTISFRGRASIAFTLRFQYRSIAQRCDSPTASSPQCSLTHVREAAIPSTIMSCRKRHSCFIASHSAFASSS